MFLLDNLFWAIAWCILRFVCVLVLNLLFFDDWFFFEAPLVFQIVRARAVVPSASAVMAARLVAPSFQYTVDTAPEHWQMLPTNWVCWQHLARFRLYRHRLLQRVLATLLCN